MRAFFLLWMATGCTRDSSGDSLVVVSVDSAAPLDGVAVLHLTATAGGKVMDQDIGDGTPFSVPPAKSFDIHVPSSVTGVLSLHVEARDANRAALASGDGMVALSPGKRVEVSVLLGVAAPDMGGADASSPPDDLAREDGKAPDLALPDLALPDLALPDLAMAPYLTGLSVSAGVLSPGFSPAVTEYTVDVRLLTQSLTLTPGADPPATIMVNGSAVATGTPSSAMPLNLGANVITIVVTGPGGQRTYTITATRGAVYDYLKASNTGASDLFGNSVALSGDTLAVGAWQEDSSTMGINTTPNESAMESGAVYVFVRSGTTWSQQAYIKPYNTGSGDHFGNSVALSGDTLAVGAHHEDSSTTGINSTPNENASDSGAAYVFVRSGSTWSQQAYIKSSNTGPDNLFGIRVALSGDTLAVGAPWEDSSTTGTNTTPDELAGYSGAVYVFVRSGSTWSEQAYIKASNNGANDGFGNSVALSGDTLAVGAPGEDSSATGINTTPNESAMESGAAYVFVRSGSTWSEQAYIKPSNAGAGDLFGYSVALSGDTLAVGAYQEDSSTTGINTTPNESAMGSGAAYVFIRSGSTWSEQAYIKPSNTGADDLFGTSVALSGDTLAVGAYQEDSSTTGINTTPNDNAMDSGAAYLFVRSGTTWSQQAYIKPSNTGADDRFGASVALSGDTLAVGAYVEDSNSTGINTTPNESAPGSGAIYVIR